MAKRCYLESAQGWFEGFIEDDSMPDDMQGWADNAAVACGLVVGAFKPVIVDDGSDPRPVDSLIAELPPKVDDQP